MSERAGSTIEDHLVRKKLQRVAVKVTGRVQSVGFRPFVYHLACRFMLQGFVRNVQDHVHIEVQGWSQDIRQFVNEMVSHPPALAKIERIEYESLPPELEVVRERSFQIETSETTDGQKLFIPADVATCEDCLTELNDRKDRRYMHPFISCVNCGPRFTVLRSLPYDRQQTSMVELSLCENCKSEFCLASDRRFHAQTISCHQCGPQLSLYSSQPGLVQAENSADWLLQIVNALSRGECVAIKGIGGYHLVCDARSSKAIQNLRKRKNRYEKPLAVMLSDLGAVHRYCHVNEQEMRLLMDRSRPVVLLRRRSDTDICGEVCFRSPFLGVMLPYTPLHHLLMQEYEGAPLVMTSANESGRPMLHEVDYSHQGEVGALKSMAETVLTHNRKIEIRCDDSVIRVADPDGLGMTILVRRSRGFAPEPIKLPFTLEEPLLAVGAQLKNTFALASENHAVLSHHIGDLDEMATYQSYIKDIDHYERLVGVQPRVFVHDCHPEYLSTRYARERSNQIGLRAVEVQHHHAHIASCMVDNGLAFDEKVIGVAFDGTGLGLDGKIWGGEFFVGTYDRFERVAHLVEVPMPGGEKAIREPWRMAQAYLLKAGIKAGVEDGRRRFGVSAAEVRTVRQMIEKELNSPMTSSMGRLFDAVAALLGVRSKISFEGQAAIELEALALEKDGAGTQPDLPSYPIPFVQDSQVPQDSMTGSRQGAPYQIDSVLMIQEIVDDMRRGVPGSEIAVRFHSSLVQMIVRVCSGIRRDSGVDKAVLSGGVFMNGILLSGAVRSLQNQGFQVFFHRQVPPNDGGISLGQLAIAAARLRREKENVLSDPRQVGGNVRGA